jgi:hypothetical protein
MDNQPSFVFTMLAGFGLGLATGTIARKTAFKGRKVSPGICADLKALYDNSVDKASETSGKEAKQHKADAKYTKGWGKAGGCSWAR